MARLGVDYGTTNTVVVCSDRGRYPIVPHTAETSIGAVTGEVFPSLVVYDRPDKRFLFGYDAERALFRPGAEERCGVLPPLKRALSAYAEGSRLGHDVVPGGFDPSAVLTAFAGDLRRSILKSGLFRDGEPMETVLTWPANAGGAQRYVTRRSFREAGFDVVGTLTEPAAAAIEFADRLARGNRAEARRLRLSIGIFDLGGGTFDVSLLKVDGPEFAVVDSQGIERLGGEDFDRVLAGLFVAALGLDFEALRPFQKALLLSHARQQKESIGAGATRTLTLLPGDVGLTGSVCTVPVTAYFRELDGLLRPAMEKLEALVSGRAAREAGIDAGRLDAIYLVGGSSKLPLVPRTLAARFPRVRLVMSDKPFSSTAMGAAIRSSEQIRMHDILARTFGVIRLSDHGQRERFDPVFPAGTRLPQEGEEALRYVHEYAPHHNIGHLRYLECAAVDAASRPCEGLRAWSDVLFPYDPQIPVGVPLSPEQIVPRPDLLDKPVVETYSCDSDGVITVRIVRRCDGQSSTYEIFRN